jgi:hypothetical protein
MSRELLATELRTEPESFDTFALQVDALAFGHRHATHEIGVNSHS